MARARTLVLRTEIEVKGADKLNNLGQRLQTTGRALTVGLTLPLAAIGGSFVAMAEEAARAEAKLVASFRSMGAAAFTTVDALKAQAAALQDATTFDDESILEAQAVLLTFGRVTGESFDRALEAALDMSALLGTDLQSSILQVGKALNDPIRGLTALRRAGVALTEQQVEQIRTLQESGDLLGAQTVLLDELEREFGQAAEAMAGTAGGQLKQALNELNDAGEQFGEIIAPVLVEIANGLKGVATFLQELNPQTREWIVRIAALTAALGPLLIVVGTLARALSGLSVVFSGAQKAGSLFARTAPLIGAAVHLMLGPIGLLTGALSLLAAVFATDFGGARSRFELSFRDLGNIFNNFALDVGDMGETVHRLADDLGVSFEDMKDRIQTEMELTGDSFDEVVRRIRQASRALFEDLRPALQESGRQWEEYQNQISVAMDDGVATVVAGADAMADEAGAIPGKMADELLANQQRLADATTELVNFMDQALSPVEERFRLRGFLASAELAEGLASNNPLVRQKATELRDEALARLGELSSFTYLSGYSAGQNFAYGLADPAVLSFVSQSASRLAAAARGIFPHSEPDDPNSPLRGITKGFGFGEILAKGILTGQGAVANAFRGLVGDDLKMPTVGTLAAAPVSAGVGGAGVVNNYIELHWSGEPPQGRTEAEIAGNLKRLSAVWGY